MFYGWEPLRDIALPGTLKFATYINAYMKESSDTALTDEELTAWCARRGVKVRCLSYYYHGQIPPQDRKCLVINYSGLNEQDLDRIFPVRG